MRLEHYTQHPSPEGSSELSVFATAREAKEFVQDQVDIRAHDETISLDSDTTVEVTSVDLPGGRYTNLYDLSYDPAQHTPQIHVSRTLKGVPMFLAGSEQGIAASGGGFFYLADRDLGKPRQAALNFAKSTDMLNMPVADQEALLVRRGQLSAQRLRALGDITIAGYELAWSGSKTNHETEARVFGNGNTVIQHVNDLETGSMRVLDERSRYTPPLELDDEQVDIGLIAEGSQHLIIETVSETGNIDMFRYDIVVRCSGRYAVMGARVQFRTLDDIALDTIEGGLSVGPLLERQDFDQHSINHDGSLGGRPPFAERPLARMAMYQTGDGRVHWTLFDGRPGSEEFTGITPSETTDIIRAKHGDVEWGCFADPGQTAKLATRGDESITSYGNTHYLKWPQNPDDGYIWVPAMGRPVASALVLK